MRLEKEWPEHPDNRGRAENTEAVNLGKNDSTPSGHPRIGGTVTLRHLAGCFEGVATDDPALLTLRAPSGAILKAGWRSIIQSGDSSQGGRP